MLLTIDVIDQATGTHWAGTTLLEPTEDPLRPAGETVTVATAGGELRTFQNSGSTIKTDAGTGTLTFSAGVLGPATDAPESTHAAAAPAVTAVPSNLIIPGIVSDGQPAKMLAQFPGARYVRVFVGPKVQNTPDDSDGLIRKIRNVCAPVWVAGGIPIVSVKLNVAQVMALRWADALHDLGARMATNPPSILVIWHEPEDDMTAETFVPYFNLAREQFRAGAGDAVPVMYAAMAYQWAPRQRGAGSNQGHTDKPGAWAKVDADIYGIDAYSGRSFPLNQILPEHPGFLRWYNEVIKRHPGRKWIVAERGFEADSAHGHGRVVAITRESDWLLSGQPAAAGCIGYVYWNTGGTEDSATLPLDRVGELAVRDLLGRLHAVTQMTGSPA